jgi:hypothetical protein
VWWSSSTAQIIPEHIARVFIIVAVNAQVLPVAAVGRIVLVVVVPMVDRKEVEIVLIEIHPALGAKPPVNIERLASVGGRIFADGRSALNSVGNLLGTLARGLGGLLLGSDSRSSARAETGASHQNSSSSTKVS